MYWPSISIENELENSQISIPSGRYETDSVNVASSLTFFCITFCTFIICFYLYILYCFNPSETVSKGCTLYHARQALAFKDLRMNSIGNWIYNIQP